MLSNYYFYDFLNPMTIWVVAEEIVKRGIGIVAVRLDSFKKVGEHLCRDYRDLEQQWTSFT